MTKFILLGGYLAKAQDGGRSFAQELVKGHGDSPRILQCLFARPSDTWQETFEKECVALGAYVPEKTPDFRLANPATFSEQISYANIIYVRGGNDRTLVEGLRQSIDWMHKLDGKTLAGSSAGADAIATYYYNLDSGSVESGLGLLPIKVIPHWRSEYGGGSINWDHAYAELKSFGDDLPILTLAEGQFEVRTV